MLDSKGSAMILGCCKAAADCCWDTVCAGALHLTLPADTLIPPTAVLKQIFSVLHLAMFIIAGFIIPCLSKIELTL